MTVKVPGQESKGDKEKIEEIKPETKSVAPVDQSKPISWHSNIGGRWEQRQ